MQDTNGFICATLHSTVDLYFQFYYILEVYIFIIFIIFWFVSGKGEKRDDLLENRKLPRCRSESSIFLIPHVRVCSREFWNVHATAVVYPRVAGENARCIFLVCVFVMKCLWVQSHQTDLCALIAIQYVQTPYSDGKKKIAPWSVNQKRKQGTFFLLRK